MRTFKWLFRFAILLSFAWIAFGQPPTPNPNGVPPTAIDAALAKVVRHVNAFREQASQRLAVELRNRGIAIGGNDSPLNSAALSELQNKATSAVREVRHQIANNVGQNGEVNVQALLNKASQLDDQQFVSQLQAGVARIIQQSGSPSPELRLGDNPE